MAINIPAAEQLSIDEIRDRVHCGWARVAKPWSEHAEYVDVQAAEITEKMLDAVRPQAGERVLELACGPGGVGLAAARRVGPTGTVVVSDVVQEMADTAAARAKRLGLGNVSALVLDIEDIKQPNGTYDVVLCREGLMFAAEPARAMQEIRRVLCPGGRAAIAVWGPRDRNPWMGVVFDAVGAVLQKQLPPPGLPGPFSLADRDRLFDLMRDAGFENVDVREVPLRRRAENLDMWWTRTSSLAGPLAAVLPTLPAEASAAIRARLETAVAPYTTADGLDFPGMTLLASARA